MKGRVVYEPYDEDLWGEPQGPPPIFMICLTCDNTVTPPWEAAHAKTCNNPALQRIMEELR